MQVKEGKCVTLDKFICYSTSLDMEKEKLEAFVQDELAAAKSEGYAPDHPILWGVPETNYLKFFLFQVI